MPPRIACMLHACGYAAKTLVLDHLLYVGRPPGGRVSLSELVTAYGKHMYTSHHTGINSHPTDLILPLLYLVYFTFCPRTRHIASMRLCERHEQPPLQIAPHHQKPVSPRGRATGDTAFHHAVANNAPRKLALPSRLVRVVKPVCCTHRRTVDSTWHDHRLCVGEGESVRAPPVWRLVSCTTPLPCSALVCPRLAMLSVARRLCERGVRGYCPAAALLPWWCQPTHALHYSRCQGADRESRKCVIANHPAMIATTKQVTPEPEVGSQRCLGPRFLVAVTAELRSDSSILSTSFPHLTT